MADMCRRCSAALPDSARFCANCGSPVEAAAVAPLDRPKIPGERKPVTALFADVVGSVTLAETMDPEDWSVLMSGALGRMETAVSRFVRLNSDGTVDTSFNVTAFLRAIVIVFQPDGKLLVCDLYGAVVRLQPDGSLDTTFHTGFSGRPPQVYSVAVQGDGK